MLRLSSLLIFAALLAYGLAQMTEPTTTEATTEAKATTTEAEATTTEAEATTTEAKPTTAPEAKPTTEAPTVPPGHYNFPNNTKPCMTVIGNMTLDVTYDNGTGTPAHKNVDLLPLLQVSYNSTCTNEKTRTFEFLFEFPEDQDDGQFITITFEKDSSIWNASEVVYSFWTHAYPDLKVDNPGYYNFKAMSNLFESNIDLGDSYSCANAKLTFDSAAINYTLNATLHIKNLQVQAFRTDKMTDGSLGAAQDCASSKGNKIVPIAVGAALAGLVIVVLIAYLIGRLKSRKQSSYEALS